jgi:Uma2 family endonuclease
MSRTASLSPPSRVLVLDDVDWRTYSRLQHILASRRDVRLTYDRGRLEIMAAALSLEHEDDKGFLGRLVIVLTEELGLPIRAGGSTTIRRQLRQRGIEPDDCYWIANAPRMRGRRRLDLRRDPPPDLAIEIDVTHSSMDRMAIYATLRIPELWQLEGDHLRFHVLGSADEYAEAEHSQSFPLVTAAHLMLFLQQARRAANQNTVVHDFRTWLRQMLGTP